MSCHHVDRRVFIKTGSLALVSLGVDPIFLTRAAYALERGNGLGDRKKTLVCIFQRGAVDGLNMIVPHGDERYYRERPRIAIPSPGKPEGALNLDSHFGFHPALKPLLPLYREGALAVVHAVGSPDSTRSHFDAQDYMETGTPGVKITADGCSIGISSTRPSTRRRRSAAWQSDLSSRARSAAPHRHWRSADSNRSGFRDAPAIGSPRLLKTSTQAQPPVS